MTAVSPRWLPLIVAALAALWVASSEYRTLWALDYQEPAANLPHLQSLQPWGGLGGRVLAASLDLSAEVDSQAARRLLDWQAQRYPLEPGLWFDRAALEWIDGGTVGDILRYVDLALSIHPQARNWNRRAAYFAAGAGDTERAEKYLQRWLAENPGGVAEALNIASAWVDGPGTLIDRVVPAGEEHLLSVITHARRQGSIELAAAAWARLPRPRPDDDPASLAFVDLALSQGRNDLAIAAWQEQFPDYEAGQVPNGDFRFPLTRSGGLHWNVQVPAGAKVTRDEQVFFTEPASLRIDFDGNQNLRLSRPWVRIPLPPESSRWVVTGFWRAEGLTTRGLPYLSASAGQGARARADVPGNRFDWTPFRLELEVPEGVSILDVQLRRDPPGQDFDRFLSGTLWLDALRVDPIAPSEPKTAATLPPG